MTNTIKAYRRIFKYQLPDGEILESVCDVDTSLDRFFTFSTIAYDIKHIEALRDEVISRGFSYHLRNVEVEDCGIVEVRV